VLYGMGYKTDLSSRRGSLRYFDAARARFAEIRRQGDNAPSLLPKHRDLVEQVAAQGFQPRRVA
jgi:tryptophan halogenase